MSDHMMNETHSSCTASVNCILRGQKLNNYKIINYDKYRYVKVMGRL